MSRGEIEPPTRRLRVRVSPVHRESWGAIPSTFRQSGVHRIHHCPARAIGVGVRRGVRNEGWQLRVQLSSSAPATVVPRTSSARASAQAARSPINLPRIHQSLDLSYRSPDLQPQAVSSILNRSTGGVAGKAITTRVCFTLRDQLVSADVLRCDEEKL